MITPEAIAALQPTPTEWGSSRYKAWRTCPRLHHLAYTVGLELAPVPADELDLLEPPDASPHADRKPQPRLVGILGHACMAEASHGRDAWDVLDAAAEGHGGPELANAGVIREVGRMLDAYRSHYDGLPGYDPSRWDIVAVEQALRSDTLGPLPVTCRVDLLLRDRGTGDHVIVDHKFRGQTLGDDHAKARRIWRTDWEFLALSHCVQERYALDAPPPVWVNALIRTKLPKFERLLVTFTETDHLPLWRREIAAADARELRLGGHRRNLSSCAPQWGEHCWAYAHCWGTQEQRDRYYQIKRKDA